MKKILIATHNSAKLEEIKIGLKELVNQGVKLLRLTDVGVEKQPKETGKTFRENAEIKARFYAKLTNLPTISDDGGLVIPYLGGGPGVKSRRWLGYEVSDQELIDYTLFNLRGCPGKKRTAFLETCVTFYLPKSHTGSEVSEVILFEQERVKGYIAEKPTGRPTNGYPFRGLFIVDKFNKYYDELTAEEHEKINHRLKALKRLTKRIKDLLR